MDSRVYGEAAKSFRKQGRREFGQRGRHWEKMHMATLTIKNIPEPLVKRLKQQAAVHRRSVNLEVISYLEQMTHSVLVDANALLVSARAVRRTPKGIRVTDRLLNSLKGRLKGMSKTSVREKQRGG